MDDLVGEPLICADKQSRGYERLLTWFGAKGIAPKIVFTSHEPMSCIRLIHEGLGIGICPAHMVQIIKGADKSLISRPLAQLNQKALLPCHQSNRKLTSYENLFIAFMTQNENP